VAFSRSVSARRLFWSRTDARSLGIIGFPETARLGKPETSPSLKATTPLFPRHAQIRLRGVYEGTRGKARLAAEQVNVPIPLSRSSIYQICRLSSTSAKTFGDSELVEQPSPFAEEINANLDSGCSLLEIGCGNGRDSCFFASNDVVVVATDICEAAINLMANRLPKDCKALVASAKDLPDDVYVDYAYARFVLHALTEDEQHDLFVWLKTHVKKKIFFETRSVNDPRCGKGKKVGNNAYGDTHYRRIMSPVDLQAAASTSEGRTHSTPFVQELKGA
jgi:tellurite methyltransferase